MLTYKEKILDFIIETDRKLQITLPWFVYV